MRSESSSMRILEWWKEYRPKRYELVGLVDIRPTCEPIVKWDVITVVAFLTAMPIGFLAGIGAFD